MMPACMVINRIKAIVLGLLAAYWLVVVVILVTARSVFDQVGGLPSHQLSADVGAVLVLTVLLALLSTGIVRGWRWTFWLILIAFVAGIRTVPIAALQLAGYRVLRVTPRWLDSEPAAVIAAIWRFSKTPS